MKKITILVITIFALGFMLSSCKIDAGLFQFGAGLYPTIGGTNWTFSTNIQGVGDVKGTIYIAKRTNSFEEIHGTLTLTAPFTTGAIEYHGSVDRYKIKINRINLGSNRAIRFDGELNEITHSKLEPGSIVEYSADTTADPINWLEGDWNGYMVSK